MKKLLFPAFIILAVAQLFIPLNMIWQTNRILNDGDAIKLLININYDLESLKKADIIYPNYEHTYVPTEPGKIPERGQRIFVILEPVENGFHVPASFSTERPKENSMYFQTSVIYVDSDETRVFFHWPIKEFKLPEPLTIPDDSNYMIERVPIAAALHAKVLNGRMLPENIEIL